LRFWQLEVPCQAYGQKHNYTKSVEAGASYCLGKHTCEVCSDIYPVSEVQAEDYPLVFVPRPSAFAFLKLLVDIIASEDATKNTSYPRL
jgi:hypothetical protein